MEVLRETSSARRYVRELQHTGEKVALIPTMGALHEGHLSLVREGRRSCGRTVATIFVNPTQFAPTEDLDQYPRTLDEDLHQLEQEGADAVFIPEIETMYPAGCTTSIMPPRIAKSLEGEFRPQHFAGVCTIVLKLFHCLPCDTAVFGMKDYQQWRVIDTMVTDFQLPIEVVAAEIVRDPDGLAMSSRNRYLSSSERQQALAIPWALEQVRSHVRNGSVKVDELQCKLLHHLANGKQLLTRGSGDQEKSESLGVDSVDYARIVDARSLEPVDSIDREVVVLVACRVGSTRLIDNCVIKL